ncbi:MAG TPA: M28 family peptidase [Pirellulaceae bacterium]|nr:M28 family peptidase [Pirellulaceae bacterium]HMO93125.1 M28 family peptidase [Pirellulaceae bacterium]HMP70316.1 M28 family peptidase [Pirellulaceae bacterium]
MIPNAMYAEVHCTQDNHEFPRFAAEQRGDENFDGETAYKVLKWLCDLGPRISGTQAMATQQAMLEAHFKHLGANVRRQEFSVRHPLTGRDTTLSNLIVEWHPDRDQRILICCHYDTRPFPDRDPHNPRGVFLGANDGASGVGLLYELGRHVKQLDTTFGIDFVFFDGEELVYERGRDEMFLGSTYFARDYVHRPPGHVYRRGVLVDMVGDKDLQIYYEINSLQYARELTVDIFQAAKELKIKEFIARSRHKVRDDHLPLNEIAKIPTTNLIDFDYPNPKSNNAYWHTTQDLPENCSAASLEKVGGVILYWLRKQEK